MVKQIEQKVTLTTPMWNVIPNEEFQKRAQHILAALATMVTNTMGPYGSTTIIEEMGNAQATKDGWNVLKRVQFREHMDMSIYDMFTNIASKVVTSVGDGTTTSVVAANSIHTNLIPLLANANTLKVTPRLLVERITDISREINKEVMSAAKSINLDTPEGIHRIYDIAMISTNGDEQLSSYIRDIYKETKNPVIKVSRSSTSETSYRIVHGYEAKVYYVDAIYTAGNEDKLTVDTRPSIVLFDHALTHSTHDDFLKHYINKMEEEAAANGKGRPLIIVGSHFDANILNTAKYLADQWMRNTMLTKVIFARTDITRSIDHDKINDLAALLGCDVFDKTIVDNYNYTEWQKVKNETGEEIIPVYTRRDENLDLNRFIGTCGVTTMGARRTLFQGLANKDEKRLETRLLDARHKVEKFEEREQKFGAVDLEKLDASVRYSELSCLMGSIEVGGASEMHQRQLMDALDDAVRASRSAVRHGYTLGGSFAVPLAIDNLLYQETDELNVNILEAIKKAFLGIFDVVCSNGAIEKPEDLYEKVKAEGKCLNLLTNKFDDKVINPVETDTQVLSAAVNIITMILTSNQYLSTSPIHAVVMSEN